MNREPVAIITPSYHNDFELAADMCRSLDKFVRFPFQHYLVVPARDLPLFGPLAGPDRHVMSRESLLKPHGFHRLPVPTVIRLPFRKPIRIREQYWKRGIGRISGWLMQQIVKLSAAGFTKADTFIFADSDVALVRPFHFEMLLENGRPRVQRHLRGLEHGMHHRWRAMAHKLIGVREPKGEHFNYIGQMIPWTRETLTRLLARIERVTEKPWRDAIAEARDVSEYILYGEYASEMPDGGVSPTFADMQLYVSVWWPEDDASGEALASELLPQTVAVHIQSTLSIPINKRRAALAAAEKAAAVPARPAA